MQMPPKEGAGQRGTCNPCPTAQPRLPLPPHVVYKTPTPLQSSCLVLSLSALAQLRWDGCTGLEATGRLGQLLRRGLAGAGWVVVCLAAVAIVSAGALNIRARGVQGQGRPHKTMAASLISSYVCWGMSSPTRPTPQALGTAKPRCRPHCVALPTVVC